MEILTAVLWVASAAGVWLDVPYVGQQKDGCGAAVISMVMRYWLAQGSGQVSSAVVDPGSIQARIGSDDIRGALASSLTGYFREHGFRAFAFRGEWSDLERHLTAGRPLIAGVAEGRLAHFVVVAGIEPARSLLIVNDPARGKLLKVRRQDFERKWKDGWTLLAVPEHP